MKIYEAHYANYGIYATYEDPNESCPSRGNSRTLPHPLSPAGTSVVKRMRSMHSGNSIRY